MNKRNAWIIKSFVIGTLLLFLFSKVSYADTSSLHLGDSGECVAALQDRLNKMGFLQEEPTGIYDHKTVRAVISYQGLHSMKKTGIADEITLKYLLPEIHTETEHQPTGMIYQIDEFPYSFEYQGRIITIENFWGVDRIEGQDRFTSGIDIFCDGGNFDEDLLMAELYKGFNKEGNAIRMWMWVESPEFLGEKATLITYSLYTTNFDYPDSAICFVSSPFVAENHPDGYWAGSTAELVIQIKDDPEGDYNRIYVYHTDNVREPGEIEQK